MARTVTAVVAGLAAACSASSGGGAGGGDGGGAAPRTFSNPVIATDFADPHVVRAGEQWYAYATGVAGQSNIAVARSSDLVHWEMLDDALPERPEWQPLAMGLTWAPEVVEIDGAWVMHYVARDAASGLQCLSVAVADAPQGPFRDTSRGPLVCQTDLGGSIDPHPFQDAGGRRYLFWKNDGNARGLDTRIWVQPLSADGRSVTGAARDTGLRQTQPWQGALVEAPTVVRRDGTYVMFYSANDYGSDRYAMGYATAASVTGPYTDRSTTPWVSSTGDAAGPGGQSVVALAEDEVWLAYHAWHPDRIGYDAGGARGMWIDRLTFDDGRPVLHGPRSTPQPLPSGRPAP